MASTNRNKNPRMAGASHRAATPEIRQRMQTPQRLSLATLEKQLADTQQTVADLSRENRHLRTVQERQDAELPRMMRSEIEELRAWKANYRGNLKIKKELDEKLKQTDIAIQSQSNQKKCYDQLNEDTSLEPHHRLNDQINGLQKQLLEKDNQMQLATRTFQLEIQSLKEQLRTEKRNFMEMQLLERRKLEELSLLKRNEEMDTLKFEISPRSTASSGLTSKPQEVPQLRTDIGDGNAAVLNENKNDSKKNKLPPEEPQPSSQGECNDDYEDASDFDDDETTDAEISAKTDENIANEMLRNDYDDEESDDVGEYEYNKIPVFTDDKESEEENNSENSEDNSN